MRIPPSTSHWSSLRIPLLLILLWWLLLFLLLMWTQRREDAYTEELARLQLETLYSSIADMRDWNAENGGVFVRENPESPANPWIPEERRALYTADGQRLVKINPAYMVRLISENFRSTMAGFRIAGLHPKRPGNRADAWEEAALKSFDDQHGERFELVRSKAPQFRALAALHAKKSCLECHEDAAEGDLLGGISLTLDAAPLSLAGEARKKDAARAFGLIGLVGTLGIGGATWQLNRKREKAEAANRLKSAFLANMTHDMRTPLTGMLGMAELLAREEEKPRRRYLLENLRDAASSLLDVVDGVMRYSLLEADRRPVLDKPFHPAGEIEACLAAVRPACESRGLKLECRISPDIPSVLSGDAFRLRQALGNVLGNAVKFTERGSISLRVSRADENGDACPLRFEVRDTGPGVPLCDRERIFESFEQGTRRTQCERGVGLGLASARLIARAAGGDGVGQAGHAVQHPARARRHLHRPMPRMQTDLIVDLVKHLLHVFLLDMARHAFRRFAHVQQAIQEVQRAHIRLPLPCRAFLCRHQHLLCALRKLSEYCHSHLSFSTKGRRQRLCLWTLPKGLRPSGLPFARLSW